MYMQEGGDMGCGLLLPPFLSCLLFPHLHCLRCSRCLHETALVIIVTRPNVPVVIVIKTMFTNCHCEGQVNPLTVIDMVASSCRLLDKLTVLIFGGINCLLNMNSVEVNI